MRVMQPFDPSTLPQASGSRPTVGEGTAQDSGLTNACGTLYFLNKSNVGVNLLFDDGSYSILPPWFARVYVLKNKTSNRVEMSQAYNLNAQGQPISQLYWEAYQQGEDTTGLYNGPLPYQLNVGNTVIQANQVQQFGQAPGTYVVEATPQAQGSVGITFPTQINNDGSFVLGSRAVVVPPANVNADGSGNFYAKTLTAGTPVALTHGAQETGKCGQSYTNVTAGQTIGPATNFKTVMTNVPTSITLNTPSENVNANAPAIGDIDIYGFWLEWTAPGAGTSRYINTYTTVGN